MKHNIWAALIIAAATGCASSTKEIAANYQSPLLYQNHTCVQIQAELDTLNRRAIQLGAKVDKASRDDNVLTGVTLLLFWPAVFALGGEEAQEAEYAQLKGHIDAVQQAGIAKNCTMPALELPKETELQAKSAKEPITWRESEDQYNIQAN